MLNVIYMMGTWGCRVVQCWCTVAYRTHRHSSIEMDKMLPRINRTNLDKMFSKNNEAKLKKKMFSFLESLQSNWHIKITIIYIGAILSCDFFHLLYQLVNRKNTKVKFLHRNNGLTWKHFLVHFSGWKKMGAKIYCHDCSHLKTLNLLIFFVWISIF